MQDNNLILHHYDFSNFSEKVRLVFALKQIGWDSVIIPSYLPKPDYLPLTGGYRRTPALQVGSDIYCDTRLIVRFPFVMRSFSCCNSPERVDSQSSCFIGSFLPHM